MKPPAQLSDNKHIHDAWNKTQASVDTMGFDYCVYCYVATDSKNSFKAITTPNAIDWGKHHLKNEYSKHDPVIKLGHSEKIFIWNSVKEENALVRKIMNERRDYGMKAGITVPIFNRLNKLTSWLSLSSHHPQKYLDDIIKNPLFLENVYELHIKTAARAISNMANIDYPTCLAIVLSTYTNNIKLISEKTGLLVDDLNKLFGHLYFCQENLNFFTLDIKIETISDIKNLSQRLTQNIFPCYRFSPRQLDCITLIKKGLTAKQAARILKISPKTYEGYIHEIKQKLNCSNQRELIFKLSGNNV